MKSLKFAIPLFILALVIAFVPACAPAAPEIIEEPVAEEPVATTEPQAIEEPVFEEEPVAEEAKDVKVEGEPELLWVFEHEDLDFSLRSLAASPDGVTLTVGSFLTTYTHQLYDGLLIDAITSHRHSVDDIDFSPDGTVMGVGLGYYGTALIDTTDGSLLFQLNDGFDNRLSFSPDGKHVATGDRDGIVWIWSLDDGEQVAALEEPDGGFMCAIDYHPSGKLIASSRWDSIVHIWDVEKEQIVHTLDIATNYMGTVFQFSPNGEIMAGVVQEDWEYIVRLWTVDGQEKLADLPIPKAVIDLSFSPDGTMLAVSSEYLETTIWDVRTGALLYTLNQILDPAEIVNGSRAGVFTPDGGHLAVVRYNGPLEFWRLPGAEPLEEPEIDMKEPPPIPSDVLFDTGSSELKAGADEVLEEIASALVAALPVAKITFVGHTDSRGASTYNLQLSIDRATAVKEWFESWAKDNNVDGWELLVDGKGEAELKVPDVDAEGTFREEAGKLNRRVEIEIGDAD